MNRVTLPCPALPTFGIAFLLGLTLGGCGQEDVVDARPVTLLFTGAVGGKIEPCG